MRNSLVVVVLLLGACTANTAVGPRPITLRLGADPAAAPLADTILSAYELNAPGSELVLATGLSETDAALRIGDRQAGFSTVIGYESIVIAAHPGNPVEWISTGRLRAMFAGRITSWDHVGGRAEPILVVMYARDDPLREAFQTRLMGSQQIVSSARIVVTPGEMAALISSTPGAIGILPGSVVPQADARTIGIDDIQPTRDNLTTRAYPLVVPVTFAAAEEPRGDARVFLEWLLGESGQMAVRQMMLGYNE
ncbi:MAG: substrate-binding domain-containing protein [Anaerolineae bacterium]